MSLELVSTEWWDKDALRLPPYKVGRVYYGNGRSYFKIDEEGLLESPFRLYTSLTTAINQCAPMERPLLEWYCKLGITEADRFLKVSQHYGTLMHICVGMWLKGNSFDFGEVQSIVDDYLSEKNFYAPECAEWPKKLRYDISAFIQFTIDYNVKPLAIEFVLLSDKGFGTLIDLVCEMDIEIEGDYGEKYKTGPRTGQTKLTKEIFRRNAVINFKSGKHGFYRSNGLQIECEKQLFEENFPDIKIDHAFNWAPKEWDINPGYNLKDWTGDISQEEVDAIIKLAQIRYGDKAIDKKFVDIYGTAWRDRGIDFVHIEDVETHCKRFYSTMPV